MRRARLSAGIKSGTAAQHADISPGTLTKYEKAENPWPVPVVYVLSEFYGLSTEDRDKLVELARKKEPGWWHRYQDIPGWFESYIGLESEAHTLLNYEDGLIPGLLQTEDYARAIFSVDAEASSEEKIEELVTVRMKRQRRLLEEPSLMLEAVVNESALHRPVGGAKVMDEQLAALLDRAELPNIDLRILPLEAGEHPANEGAFVIMKFPDVLEDVAFEDIVAIEYRAGVFFLENEQDVGLYARIFQQTQAQSLGPRESGKRIRGIRKDLYEG